MDARPCAHSGFTNFAAISHIGNREIAIARAHNDDTSIAHHHTGRHPLQFHTLDFIKADIRTLDLPKKYDLIFIPFNSIHHLYKNEDVFKAFTVVKSHLKKGGLLLLDCFNPNIQFIVEGEKEQKEIAQYKTKDGREVLIKQTMRYENKTQINRIEWHYFINGEFESVQNLDMRLFFPQELDSYLEWNGFKIIHKFGGFEEEVFNDKSEKQIFVCH